MKFFTIFLQQNILTFFFFIIMYIYCIYKYYKQQLIVHKMKLKIKKNTFLYQNKIKPNKILFFNNIQYIIKIYYFKQKIEIKLIIIKLLSSICILYTRYKHTRGYIFFLFIYFYNQKISVVSLIFLKLFFEGEFCIFYLSKTYSYFKYRKVNNYMHFNQNSNFCNTLS